MELKNRVGAHYSGSNIIAEKVTAKIKDEYSQTNGKFTYLDFPSVFNANQGKYVSSDGIHPSSAGYNYYIEELNKILEY